MTEISEIFRLTAEGEIEVHTDNENLKGDYEVRIMAQLINDLAVTST